MSQQKDDSDFVHMANNKIEGCTSCHKCGQTGYCILPPSNNDNFQKIFDKFVMIDYRFDHSTYKNLNSIINPQEYYKDITKYIMDTLKQLTQDYKQITQTRIAK